VDNPNLRGAVQYVPFEAKSPDDLVPGILTRKSHRWFRHWDSSEYLLPVPYIDRAGKFTIHKLGVWKCHPETWFGSVSSTVSNRLLNLLNRRSHGRLYMSKQIRTLLFRIACLYTYTHSNYFLDRVLANLRPERLKVLKNLFFFYLRKSGANFRFVYNQTNINVSWFLFRSKWIRDKPQIVERFLSKETLVCYKRSPKGRYRFFRVNPFLSAVNWLRLNLD
jgi:hypothetical protein